jgi:hypothetical protein
MTPPLGPQVEITAEDEARAAQAWEESTLPEFTNLADAEEEVGEEEE